jgi:hypothetical protein
MRLCDGSQRVNSKVDFRENKSAGFSGIILWQFLPNFKVTPFGRKDHPHL